LALIDILAGGSLAVDDKVFIAGELQVDGKHTVIREERSFGGVARTAMLAARLFCDARCVYCGTLGRNELSDLVMKDLVAMGVDDCDVVFQEGSGPCHSTICIDELGTRTILIRRNGGAHPEWPDEATIGAARTVMVDEYGLKGQLRIARTARVKGVPVVGDLENESGAVFDALMDEVDHLIVPENCAYRVCDTNEPEEAVQRLWKPSRALVAVTCGIRGSYFTEDGLNVHFQPSFPVQSEDTTGAGDVFHGLYTVGLLNGVSAAENIRLASAGAAFKAKTGRPPTRSELEEFLLGSV
jgi:sulfofructose kinase